MDQDTEELIRHAQEEMRAIEEEREEMINFDTAERETELDELVDRVLAAPPIVVPRFTAGDTFVRPRDPGPTLPLNDPPGVMLVAPHAIEEARTMLREGAFTLQPATPFARATTFRTTVDRANVETRTPPIECEATNCNETNWQRTERVAYTQTRYLRSERERWSTTEDAEEDDDELITAERWICWNGHHASEAITQRLNRRIRNNA